MTDQPRSADAVSGIVLAAGSSRRYGADKRRQRTPSGFSLLEATIQRAAEVLPRLIVALRADDGDYRRELQPRFPAPRVRFLLAEHSASGMGASLADAATQLDDSGACLVILGDMPFVTLATYGSIVQAWIDQGAGIVMPAHHGQRGHPVLFDRRHFPALARLDGDEGARRVVRAQAADVLEVAVEDPGILRDVDTPGDWQ